MLSTLTVLTVVLLTVVVEPDVFVPCFEARGLSAQRPVVVSWV